MGVWMIEFRTWDFTTVVGRSIEHGDALAPCSQRSYKCKFGAQV